jgi:hypothetical protein
MSEQVILITGETILSTIKIRQASFADCIDTHQSFRWQLTRLRDLRVTLVPKLLIQGSSHEASEL